MGEQRREGVAACDGVHYSFCIIIKLFLKIIFKVGKYLLLVSPVCINACRWGSQFDNVFELLPC